MERQKRKTHRNQNTRKHRCVSGSVDNICSCAIFTRFILMLCVFNECAIRVRILLKRSTCNMARNARLVEHNICVHAYTHTHARSRINSYALAAAHTSKKFQHKMESAQHIWAICIFVHLYRHAHVCVYARV